MILEAAFEEFQTVRSWILIQDDSIIASRSETGDFGFTYLTISFPVLPVNRHFVLRAETVFRVLLEDE